MNEQFRKTYGILSPAKEYIRIMTCKSCRGCKHYFVEPNENPCRKCLHNGLILYEKEDEKNGAN